MTKRKPGKTPILTQRSALLLVCAMLAAAAAAALTYLGSHNPAQTAIAGAGTFAAALVWFDKIIADNG